MAGDWGEDPQRQDYNEAEMYLHSSPIASGYGYNQPFKGVIGG
jgi:hypothetical protein